LGYFPSHPTWSRARVDEFPEIQIDVSVSREIGRDHLQGFCARDFSNGDKLAFMLHSSSLARRSRTSFSSLVVALSLLVAAPAFAKKKAATEDAPAAAPASSEAAPADPKLVPPTPDTFGRVHFGPSSGADLGRVSVKAPAGDNVKVFLEGRFFGTAPITIYSVPKGDYILEGTFPDGKSVSKPVSVLENDEAVIDLTGAHAALESPSKNGGGMFSNKGISESRMTAMYGFAIGGAVGLVMGITFGILEKSKESDYKNAPNNQNQLDNIASSGKNYALLANIGFALTFVGAIGAAVCAYPLFVKPNAEKPKTVALSQPTFVVVPTQSGAAGSLGFRF